MGALQRSNGLNSVKSHLRAAAQVAYKTAYKRYFIVSVSVVKDDKIPRNCTAQYADRMGQNDARAKQDLNKNVFELCPRTLQAYLYRLYSNAYYLQSLKYKPKIRVAASCMADYADQLGERDARYKKAPVNNVFAHCPGKYQQYLEKLYVNSFYLAKSSAKIANKPVAKKKVSVSRYCTAMYAESLGKHEGAKKQSRPVLNFSNCPKSLQPLLQKIFLANYQLQRQAVAKKTASQCKAGYAEKLGKQDAARNRGLRQSVFSACPGNMQPILQKLYVSVYQLSLKKQAQAQPVRPKLVQPKQVQPTPIAPKRIRPQLAQPTAPKPEQPVLAQPKPVQSSPAHKSNTVYAGLCSVKGAYQRGIRDARLGKKPNYSLFDSCSSLSQARLSIQYPQRLMAPSPPSNVLLTKIEAGCYNRALCKTIPYSDFYLTVAKCGVKSHILNQSFRTIINQHDYPAYLRSLLGEALVSAVLMTNILKFKGELTVQFNQSQGALQMLVVKCNHRNQIRALAKWDPDASKQDLANDLGQGQLVVTIAPDDVVRPYQSIIALEQGSVTAALERYFIQSEQLPTRFWCAVSETQALGMLLQYLPESAQSNAEQHLNFWEHATQLSETLTSQEMLSLTNEALLHRLYHQESVRLFSPEKIEFHCRCSQAAMENAVRALGQQEASSILKTNKHIGVTCEYCNNEYAFDRIAVAKIFDSTLH